MSIARTVIKSSVHGAPAIVALTDDIFQDRTPRWSPDGKRIAFMSNRTGNWQVWTIKPDGSGLEQLTDAPGDGTAAPTWSPDGARLLGQPFRRARSFVIQVGKPWKDQSPEPLSVSESGSPGHREPRRSHHQHGLPDGVTNSLIGPLDAASSVLINDNPRNDIAACGELAAFFNQVNAKAQSGC